MKRYGPAILLIGLGLAALGFGAIDFPPDQLCRILLSHLFPSIITPDWSPGLEVILWNLRLPRLLLAILVGAGLSVSGAVLQAVTRNVLADPYLLGLSSGASFGVVFMLVVLGGEGGVWSSSAAAFLGALFSLLLVVAITAPGRNLSPERLTLAGVCCAFLLSAATNTLVYFGGTNVGQKVLFWMLGGLGGARWDNLSIPAAVVAGVSAFCLSRHRVLDALAFGEETASTLGIAVPQVRWILMIAVTLMTAVLVSLSGVIGFVGLVVPHIARALVGGAHGRVLPFCAQLGAIFVVFADMLARTVNAPAEIPIGLITSGIGGLYFASMLRRNASPRSGF